MATPSVIVLRTPGTNCDEETAHAFQLAGASTSRVHVEELVRNRNLLQEFQILCIPGGFSYGDDLGAGRIAAARLRHHLLDALIEFQTHDRLVLGICNGFQILIASGLFFQPSANEASANRLATLAANASGKYEDRWVRLESASSTCVFTRGIDSLYLPVAHAEGRFVIRDQAAREILVDQDQIALTYAAKYGAECVAYPDNPNGSADDVASICDATGRVCGLMPHPERYVDRIQHPRWTRLDLPNEGDGLRLFRNAVDYFT